MQALTWQMWLTILIVRERELRPEEPGALDVRREHECLPDGGQGGGRERVAVGGVAHAHYGTEAEVARNAGQRRLHGGGEPWDVEGKSV